MDRPHQSMPPNHAFLQDAAATVYRCPWWRHGKLASIAFACRRPVHDSPVPMEPWRRGHGRPGCQLLHMIHDQAAPPPCMPWRRGDWEFGYHGKASKACMVMLQHDVMQHYCWLLTSLQCHVQNNLQIRPSSRTINTTNLCQSQTASAMELAGSVVPFICWQTHKILTELVIRANSYPDNDPGCIMH